MKQDKQNIMHMLKRSFINGKDWFMDHSKIILPLVLVICVIITVLIAVNANHKDTLQKEAEVAATAVTEENDVTIEGIEKPQYELEENAYQDVNSVLRTYYDAQAAGDVEVISSLNTYLNDIEMIRVQEMSKYIESYPVLDVYTKPGLKVDSYVAYVYSEVKFVDVEQELPGMQTYYIEKDANADFHINDGTYDNSVWEYIKEVTLQDDVVDLNNKVVVAYNELLAGDEELSEFIAYLKEKINEDVGEILAEVEQPVEETEDTEQETQSTEVISGTTIVRTTDVVNIRSSDSETADKLDRAMLGQEFKLLEQRGNGWSKIEFEGKEAFIKSDYLEIVLQETPTPDTEVAESTQTSEQTTQESTNVQTDGTVKVIENVKIRKGASTNSEALATAYVGQELELVMKQADGWTKVKYDGQVAYVKSDYVE